MRIPTDMMERQRFYEDLTRQCLVSRMERFEFYRACRNYYLFGTLDEGGAAYNKIESAVDTLVSFIYSPDAVRFVLSVGSTAGKDDVHRAAPLAEEVGQQWRMSHTHLLFKNALTWSFVYGAMFMKVGWRNGVARTWLVEPHQFGVLREDVPGLEDQEAFVMCYTVTRTQLEANLQGNPRRESIMQRVGRHTGEGTPSFGDGMTRLLLANPVGGVPGSVSQQFGPTGGPGGNTEGTMAAGASQYNYAPMVAADLVDMRELYVRDDATGDYQVITLAAPDVIIYDRPQSQLGVGKMAHFVRVWGEDKLYDYFWGSSYVAKLAGLQDWRTEDTLNIRRLQAKQSDPPMAASSAGGIQDAKLAALRQAGGRATIPDAPGFKLDVLAPKMPEAPFQTINEIDNMFGDSAGIGHVLQGKGEAGVRSRGQTDVLARLGSARVKAKAIVAEECAEDVATLMLHNLREYSDQRFRSEVPGKGEEDGLQFVASQFTMDFELKVDAHSSSPIFVEDHKVEAKEMLELGIIDGETFLDMVNPPNKQMLKLRYQVLKAEKAKAQQMQMEMEAQRHAGGRPKGA